MAGRDGVPLIGFPAVFPRAATGFVYPNLRVLQRLGLLPDNVDDLEMIDYIRILQESWLGSPRRNQAKQLAQSATGSR